MALKVTDDCINCALCEMECPYSAIYPYEVKFRLSGNKYLHFCHDTTIIKDNFPSGTHYYIIPDKCTECIGLSDLPRCLKVCPIDGIVHDAEHRESEEHLYSKKEYLDTLQPWKCG